MIGRTLLFSNPAHLSYSLQQLKVEREGHAACTVPLEDVHYVIIEHTHITCSAYLLQELASRNICTIFCDTKYHPVGMLSSLDANQVQSERFRAQLAASEPLKKNLWMQTVKAKVQNQAAVLELFGHDTSPLITRSKKVRSGDPQNEEGRAAAMYWPRLLGSEFKRERYGDQPNSLLNYGYAILRAATARALAGSGLHPTLGIFHRNKYNAYCLADDIMEPYRPYVDRMVMDYMQEHGIEEELSKESKHYLLGILTVDCKMGEKTHPLTIALQRSSYSLVECFMGTRKQLIYPSLA